MMKKMYFWQLKQRPVQSYDYRPDTKFTEELSAVGDEFSYFSESESRHYIFGTPTPFYGGHIGTTDIVAARRAKDGEAYEFLTESGEIYYCPDSERNRRAIVAY